MDTQTKKPKLFVEVKSRASHNQAGTYDCIPIEPNVIDPHIRKNGREPWYNVKCLLVVAIEKFEKEPSPKVLWAFIDESLAIDLRVSYEWKRDMYHPKVTSFHDNAKEPLLDVLRNL